MCMYTLKHREMQYHLKFKKLGCVPILIEKPFICKTFYFFLTFNFFFQESEYFVDPSDPNLYLPSNIVPVLDQSSNGLPRGGHSSDLYQIGINMDHEVHQDVFMDNTPRRASVIRLNSSRL